jgi:hypothetical protein
MQKPDHKRFHAVMAAMGENFSKPPSTTLLDLYWQSLADWSIEEFEAAARQLLQTAEFMPRIADFVKLRAAADRETAGEVFASLRQWLKYSPNGYTLQPYTPRAIATAIGAIGGVQAYAMAHADQMPFLERRFCEHYHDIHQAEEAREALPYAPLRGALPAPPGRSLPAPDELEQ